MKKIRTFNWKMVPVVGAGAFLDLYRKEESGLDGWCYTIVLPFIIIRFGLIYLN